MHDYSQSGDPSARMMTGFLVGAMVGAGLALLLAPATGEDTRRRLKETASRIRDNADEALGQVRERFDEARQGKAGREGTGSEGVGTEGFGAGMPGGRTT